MKKYTITFFEDEVDLLISLFDIPLRVTIDDAPTFNGDEEDFSDTMDEVHLKCLAARGVNPYHVVKMISATYELWDVIDTRQSEISGTRIIAVRKTRHEAYEFADKKYRELVKGTKWEVVDEENGFFSNETMSKISKLMTSLKASE